MQLLEKVLKGNKRSVKAKKNIIVSILLKGMDMLIYIILVPVTIGYLNAYEYGIWLTINSILMWINSFDIGLGNGLRNKLGTAIAENNSKLARSYVSSAFVMLLILMSIILFVGLFLISNLNLYRIINVDEETVPNLYGVVNCSLIFFCINFALKFVGNVYQALQLPSINTGMTVFAHLISLVVIYLFTLFTSGSLLYVAIIYSSAPTIVYILAYPLTFNYLYKNLSPTISSINVKCMKELCNLGISFFLLQISSLVLFSLSNILISHLFGPNEVTPYNLSNRYFSFLTFGMSFILTPMWSATTDAYAKNDLIWIKNSMRYIVKINIFATFCLFIMLLASPYAYHLWIGDKVYIPFRLSVLMAIYLTIIMWSTAFSSYLNGMGKLKVQTYNVIVCAILYFPICYTLGLNFRVEGIVLGMCILNLSGLILNIIQFNKLINGSTSAIWNK